MLNVQKNSNKDLLGIKLCTNTLHNFSILTANGSKFYDYYFRVQIENEIDSEKVLSLKSTSTN